MRMGLIAISGYALDLAIRAVALTAAITRLDREPILMARTYEQRTRRSVPEG
jgi:hypothetical protein